MIRRAHGCAGSLPAHRYVAAATAAVLAAVGLVVLGAPPAVAGGSSTITQTVNYRCDLAVFGVDDIDIVRPLQVTITTPTSVPNGSTFNLLWSINHMPISGDTDDTGVTTTTTAYVNVKHQSGSSELRGAGTDVSPVGTVTTGQPYPGITTVKIPYRPVVAGSGGDVLTIQPADIVVDWITDDYGLSDAGAELTCEPTDSPPATLATINVVGAAPACATTNTCTGTQTLVGSPPSGKLLFYLLPNTGSYPTITMPDIVSSTTAQTVSTDVNIARITDTRGGSYGWSLTGQWDGHFTNIATSTNVPGVQLSLTNVNCSETAGASGSAPVGNGPGGNLTSTQSLCFGDSGVLGNTGAHGGQWDVTGHLTMTVPPFLAASEYSAAITITLA